MKKAISIILILVFCSYCLTAQNSCTVKSGKAFFYEVISGVNNTTISTTGNELTDKTPESLNVSVYLVTSCAQTPVISYSTFGKQKIKLEFIKINSDREEVGYDMNGKIKVIKVAKGTFLWKANWPVLSKISISEKRKILIKGVIGGKKFNYTILYTEKLQPIAMY